MIVNVCTSLVIWTVLYKRFPTNTERPVSQAHTMHVQAHTMLTRAKFRFILLLLAFEEAMVCRTVYSTDSLL